MTTTWLCDKDMLKEHRDVLTKIVSLEIETEDHITDIARDALTVLDEFERVDGMVRSLYSILAHGDAKHRQWLESTINEHFGIKP